MISVGVDVSKGKSTICILKSYGEIVCSPFEVQHEEGAMEAFVDLLAKLDGEIRVVMEATGIYHFIAIMKLAFEGKIIHNIHILVWIKTGSKIVSNGRC